jgi:hypothetical protein
MRVVRKRGSLNLATLFNYFRKETSVENPFKAKYEVPAFQILNTHPVKRAKRRGGAGRPPSEMSLLLAKGKTLFFPGISQEKDRGRLAGRFGTKHSYLRHRNFHVRTMIIPSKGLYIWAEKAPRRKPAVSEQPQPVEA